MNDISIREPDHLQTQHFNGGGPGGVILTLIVMNGTIEFDYELMIDTEKISDERPFPFTVVNNDRILPPPFKSYLPVT